MEEKVSLCARLLYAELKFIVSRSILLKLSLWAHKLLQAMAP